MAIRLRLGLLSSVGGRANQASKEIQDGNTQFEHSAKKCLRGSGNTISESEAFLMSTQNYAFMDK